MVGGVHRLLDMVLILIGCVPDSFQQGPPGSAKQEFTVSVKVVEVQWSFNRRLHCAVHTNFAFAGLYVLWNFMLCPVPMMCSAMADFSEAPSPWTAREITCPEVEVCVFYNLEDIPCEGHCFTNLWEICPS